MGQGSSTTYKYIISEAFGNWGIILPSLQSVAARDHYSQRFWTPKPQGPKHL